MKTALQIYIEQLEKNPNDVLTKANVIHHAKTFIELEQDQLIDMGNLYYNKFKSMGIVTQDGQEVFNTLYKNISK